MSTLQIRPWLLTGLMLISFGAGVWAQRVQIPSRVLSRLSPPVPAPVAVLPPSSWRSPFVLLVAGQSNAANHGIPRTRAGVNAYALAAGGLFRLEDPLPGASGTGGSPWPSWASLRQRSDPNAQVVVVSVAQGSSAVTDWIPGGIHSGRMASALGEVQRQGLNVSAVLWHQGETEAWAGADPSIYRRKLLDWIASVRRLGITAPIFVSLTSRDGQGVIHPGLRQAQSSVWNRSARVFAGPDTDSLGDAFRSDGVHFNQKGLEAVAHLVQISLQHPSDRRAPTLADLSTP